MDKTSEQLKLENEELKAALLESTRLIADVYTSWRYKGFIIYNVSGYRMQETMNKNRNLLRITDDTL